MIVAVRGVWLVLVVFPSPLLRERRVVQPGLVEKRPFEGREAVEAQRKDALRPWRGRREEIAPEKVIRDVEAQEAEERRRDVELRGELRPERARRKTSRRDKEGRPVLARVRRAEAWKADGLPRIRRRVIADDEDDRVAAAL